MLKTDNILSTTINGHLSDCFRFLRSLLFCLYKQAMCCSAFSARLFKQVRLQYGSGTVIRLASGQPADAACALTRRQHFSAWNDVNAAILKVGSHIRSPLRQSMLIYTCITILPHFMSIRFETKETQVSFEDGHPEQEEQEQQYEYQSGISSW